MKKWILFAGLVWGYMQTQAQSWYPLYEGAIPGNLTDTVRESHTGSVLSPDWFFAVTKPMVQVFAPAHPNGTSLLIFPGGGYHGLSWKNEGTDIARDFTDLGVTCFIVKYRLPDHRYMEHAENVALADAVTAMRWVKKRAAAYQLDPAKIGCIGFSAGGHLAGSFANLADPDARPAFTLLVYPVVSMQPGLVHAGSRELLLGKDPSPETVARYSNEWQVTSHTPPCYITHSQDDRIVNVDNSIRLYEALTAHQVPAEMHLVPKGDHGFIFSIPLSQWLDPMVEWLQRNNFIVPEIDGRGKTVILTFDDAVKSHFTVIPAMLQRYHFGATFYVCEFPPNFDDTSKYMSWRQIQSLSAMGYEIGNHTWHHAGFAGLPIPKMDSEIVYIDEQCKRWGIPKPTSFCYPAYATDSNCLPLLRKYGYTNARTGGHRPWEPSKENPFYIPCYTINGNDPGYFYKALLTATETNAIVFCVHGVPDLAHDWVNTPPAVFEKYLQYLSNHHFRVVSMRGYLSEPTPGSSRRKRP